MKTQYQIIVESINHCDSPNITRQELLRNILREQRELNSRWNFDNIRNGLTHAGFLEKVDSGVYRIIKKIPTELKVSDLKYFHYEFKGRMNNICQVIYSLDQPFTEKEFIELYLSKYNFTIKTMRLIPEEFELYGFNRTVEFKIFRCLIRLGFLTRSKSGFQSHLEVLYGVDNIDKEKFNGDIERAYKTVEWQKSR